MHYKDLASIIRSQNKRHGTGHSINLVSGKKSATRKIILSGCTLTYFVLKNQ